MLTDEEIRGTRPTPLDCGRCERGGDECRLTELDKARCWARKSAEAEHKATLKAVGKWLVSKQVIEERQYGKVRLLLNDEIESLLRGEGPECGERPE